jgi:hypothetical protein
LHRSLDKLIQELEVVSNTTYRSNFQESVDETIIHNNRVSSNLVAKRFIDRQLINGQATLNKERSVSEVYDFV